jgi:N,N'-diacetyllegionaminate synthase
MTPKFKRCYIIAEIGVNHNGSMSLAKKLIDRAKSSGADAVKFQTFKAERLSKKNTPKVAYQKRSGSKKETHFEMLKKLELKEKDHILLKNYCHKKKIDFISTAYDVDSAMFLNKLGVKIFKTASADIVDHQMHKFLSKTGKHVIISTGMATIDEINQVIKIYKNKKNFSLLHCTSNYPCSDKSINVKNLLTLKRKYKCIVGYSDHSVGNLASITSIAYGAKIIEKHFTLSKKMKGPDHFASITSRDLKDLVDDIRRTEKILGSEIRKVQKEEMSMRNVSRKSLIYKTNLNSGHIVRDKDITSIRPGTGMLGNKIDIIIGKKIKKKIIKGSFVKVSDFEKK